MATYQEVAGDENAHAHQGGQAGGKGDAACHTAGHCIGDHLAGATPLGAVGGFAAALGHFGLAVSRLRSAGLGG